MKCGRPRSVYSDVKALLEGGSSEVVGDLNSLSSSSCSLPLSKANIGLILVDYSDMAVELELDDDEVNRQKIELAVRDVIGEYTRYQSAKQEGPEQVSELGKVLAMEWFNFGF
jgi:hypothetical protein